MLEAGRRALPKLESGDLDPEEVGGLEAIILLTGRPSFVVEGDVPIVPEGSQYKGDLDFSRARIESVVKAVGRLNVPAGEGTRHLGTVFLVSDDLVMTNRHVADLLVVQDGNSWKFKPGLTASVDFKGEHGSPPGDPYDITEPVFVHLDAAIDLALFRVARTSSTGTRLPCPTKLSVDPDAADANRSVYTIGFPTRDPKQGPADVIRIFGSTFDVKRLAPGTIMGVCPRMRQFSHDCSTLMGSSGSCVVDFSTHQVVGLHAAGNYKERNFAASLPAIKDDPKVTCKGLNFQQLR
jgi:hypothetical protein